MQGASTSTAGSGLQSGSIAAPSTRVTNVNGTIITTITLDLENLSGSNNPTGSQVVIGNAEARADGASPAYLIEWNESLNGNCYRVELSCIETPVGGAANATFCLSGSTLGTYEQDDVPAGDPYAIFGMTGSLSKGTSVSSLGAAGEIETVSTEIADGEFVYMCNQTAGAAGSPGKYTAGKLIFNFYGHKTF